ncbi:MAG: alpha-N-arabinofuranosidase, partial [Armatimonadetes bacterium CG_4_9_14_3_um_filter_58_7]
MAQLNIDIDRRVGAIDPNIFGNFVEHLGRCIYTGIFDPESRLSDTRGFRKDALAAVQLLQIPILRY